MDTPQSPAAPPAAPSQPDPMGLKVDNKTTSDEKIKNMKHVYIEMREPSTGKTLGGDFVFKRLTLGEITRVGAEVARRNGYTNIDPATNELNNYISQLKFSLVSAPEWFKPDEMYDAGMVAVVYAEVAKFEESFRSPLPGSSQTSQAPR